MITGLDAEWLETDGQGGFASGTVSGIRTRRYHALLLIATAPPTGRVVLINGFDATVTTPRATYALSSQKYSPDVVDPDGSSRIAAFEAEPWPKWTYELDDGTVVVQEIFIPRGTALTAVSWRLQQSAEDVTLCVRPFLSGRDYHSLHHENAGFGAAAEVGEGRVRWQPYGGTPAIVALTNGTYRHAPDWYRNFQYDAERERGLDFTEDLVVPGAFEWNVGKQEAVWLLAAESKVPEVLSTTESAPALIERLRASEARERSRRPGLSRAADAYLVQRHEGRTIIAGYPWFTDWGRDTFIAMRGLCLATGRLEEAREILVEWAGALSEGMLPNRFPDAGESPEFNSVDASLWFVVAAYELMLEARHRRRTLGKAAAGTLRDAVRAILEGYTRGTRFGIRCDTDGLLAAGQPGVQLTWMDAKVGDWVVTPRIGKPVEVQALWLNALRIGMELCGFEAAFDRASTSFAQRFWNESRGFLYDVVDADHIAGRVDPSFRPNQIFAVGGLPFSILDGEKARSVVDRVEGDLLTRLGLRSLAPGEAGYVGRYQGGVRERDGSYHQGTAWPWLSGAFVEAWVRVRGGTAAAKREARQRFLVPLLEHVQQAGIGHVSEIADGDAPHTPRGCPFQAWSVGEALRMERFLGASS